MKKRNVKNKIKPSVSGVKIFAIRYQLTFYMIFVGGLEVLFGGGRAGLVCAERSDPDPVQNRTGSATLLVSPLTCPPIRSNMTAHSPSTMS
jgi:hypothetical protein